MMLSTLVGPWRAFHHLALRKSYRHTSFARNTSYNLSRPFAKCLQPEQLRRVTTVSSQDPHRPQLLQPYVHNPYSATWVPYENKSPRALERGSIIKVVSWNINMNAPDPAARASAALEHLRLLFGDTLRRQVIMLQEVLLESLQAILDNPWVQTNFAVSNVCPPNSLCTDVLGETFVMTRVDWRAEPYFTLIMVSKDMGVIDCLRIPFVTEMGRDALAVDIHVCDPSHTDQTLPPERAQPLRSIRICTTHLESLWQGKFRAMRLEQLATISALLKGTPSMNSRPIGGLVGGDMNSVGPAEHEFHKDRSVDLKDVWNGDSLPPLPMKEPGQGDKTYGRSTGSTWGHHADSPRRSKRVDKFLYTGSIEVVALSELQDFTGEVGRLGIILKTKVKASKIKEKRKPIKLGKDVQEGSRKYLTKGQADWERAREWRLRHWSSKYTPEQRNVWVSDHFGIAVGIKVL